MYMYLCICIHLLIVSIVFRTSDGFHWMRTLAFGCIYASRTPMPHFLDNNYFCLGGIWPTLRRKYIFGKCTPTRTKHGHRGSIKWHMKPKENTTYIFCVLHVGTFDAWHHLTCVPLTACPYNPSRRSLFGIGRRAMKAQGRLL